MKRYGNLFPKVYDINNIELADKNARKNKPKNWGIIKHDKHRDTDNKELQVKLKTLTYKTSEYSTFKIYEPKERIIFRLPYFPDRVTHHAIMNITESIWVKTFLTKTYSCIKNRGIHKLASDLKSTLKKDPEGTKYCLKIDIVKFYPSIDHGILKETVRRKIKDRQLLQILDEIIDSAKGVPIGNYLSQFFANLYLAYFGHWVMEEIKVELAKQGATLYYFQYADDIAFLSNSKEALHKVLICVKLYLKHVLKLLVKNNYQIFPVDSRGIDFVGYRFFHTHVLLRKSIKLNLKRLISKYKKGKISLSELDRRLRSYFGWLKYCNSKNLLNIIHKETNLRFSNWQGKQSIISRFYNKYIHIIQIVPYSKYFRINFIYKGQAYTVRSTNRLLFKTIVSHMKFPLNFKLKPYVRSKANRNKHTA